jgi:vacuolar-type H+-ATPase subunit F/Vma7
MSKVACICDKELKSLFEAFGIDAFEAEAKSAKAVVEEAVKKDYSIIYILEKLAKDILDWIDAVREGGLVSVVILPDHISDLGLGTSLARRSAIDAVGTDAVFVKGESR